MEQGVVIDLAQKALKVVIYVSAPMLLISLVVGLIISIFQATTQIQEQTLTFVPKILSVFASVLLFGAWMLNILIEFTRGLYLDMYNYIR